VHIFGKCIIECKSSITESPCFRLRVSVCLIISSFLALFAAQTRSARALTPQRTHARARTHKYNHTSTHFLVFRYCCEACIQSKCRALTLGGGSACRNHGHEYLERRSLCICLPSDVRRLSLSSTNLIVNFFDFSTSYLMLLCRLFCSADTVLCCTHEWANKVWRRIWSTSNIATRCFSCRSSS
jgi:hypothetical protein